MRKHKLVLFLTIIILMFFLIPAFAKESKLINLIPEIEGWKLRESPQIFHPENLYEYINGGAEIYLSYDFQELIVAEFQNNEGKSIIIEIYNMGNEKNSFGIYSIERSPESKYLSLGNHGYIDGESLYFIVGNYYIKINCFECNSKAKNYLLNFAKEILNRVENKGKLPEALKFFPRKGLIKNSEKFILKNFMGYDFLKNAFQAEYKIIGKEFTIFILENNNEEEAKEVFGKIKNYFEKARSIEPLEIKDKKGISVPDKYYKKITFVLAGEYLFGTLKLEDFNVIEQYLSMVISKIGEEQ